MGNRFLHALLLSKMIIAADICAPLTDQELVNKSLDDLEYFGCLYQRYESKILRYIQRLSGMDDEEALDILQDIFIKVWRNIHAYDPALPFSSWLYRIAHNVIISTWKSKQHLAKQLDLLTGENTIWWNDMTANDDEDQLKKLVPAGLQQLKAKYRDVLILHYLESKPYLDISDILKIPLGTVAIRMNRAKQLMKKYLEKHLKKNAS